MELRKNDIFFVWSENIVDFLTNNLLRVEMFVGNKSSMEFWF